MSSREPLFSDHWYRIKSLKPRLADDVVIERHAYRGRLWWVLHRPSTRSVYRIDDGTHGLLELLDGRTRVDDIWQRNLERHGDQAGTQEDMIGLLAALHEAQLLTSNQKLNAEQMFARRTDAETRERKERYLNPLFMRFSLFDPDPWLAATRPLWGPLTGRPALISWLFLVAGALVVLAPEWQRLSRELAAFQPFSAGSVAIFFFVYPLLKLVHELAHGAMVKKAGGEVHEMGIALMVLLPIPFVDASSSAACPDKGTRIAVSAAGILVELGAAALAALVWSATQPGLVHEIALTTMVIGSLSTLLFNGNPLLKFDGYFILADALEIPNLAERSRSYWLSLGRRRFFGVTEEPPRFADRLEKAWVQAYGVLSTLYRLVLMATIVIMLSGSYFFFGVILAFWALYTAVGRPLLRLASVVLSDHQVPRRRALTVCALACTLLVVLLGAVSWPTRIATQGVVWLPDDAILRSPDNCEVVEEHVADGTWVTRGAALFDCTNPELETDAAVLRARLDELLARRAGLAVNDRVDEQVLTHQIDALTGQLQQTEKQIAALSIVAASDGMYVRPSTEALLGQHLQQGELAAYVVPNGVRTVRLAVPEDAAGALPGAGSIASVRVAKPDEAFTFEAPISRQSPSAVLSVPTVALTTIGGGPHPAKPEGDGAEVTNPVIDVELLWPADTPPAPVGSHVSVIIRGPEATAAARIVDSVRRTFLSHLSA